MGGMSMDKLSHRAPIEDAMPVYSAFLGGTKEDIQSIVEAAEAGKLHPEINAYVGKVVMYLEDIGAGLGN